MDRRRFAAVMVVLAVIAGVVWLPQATITPAPAHGGKVKITGKVTDKILKHFDGSAGLPGVRSIELRRFTMAPGAKMEGDIVFGDHAELCIVQKGSITVTLPDGTKQVFKEGDIYITPAGTKQKVVAADPTLGFDELVWTIKIKARH